MMKSLVVTILLGITGLVAFYMLGLSWYGSAVAGSVSATVWGVLVLRMVENWHLRRVLREQPPLRHVASALRCWLPVELMELLLMAVMLGVSLAQRFYWLAAMLAVLLVVLTGASVVRLLASEQGATRPERMMARPLPQARLYALLWSLIVFVMFAFWMAGVISLASVVVLLVGASVLFGLAYALQVARFSTR